MAQTKGNPDLSLSPVGADGPRGYFSGIAERRQCSMSLISYDSRISRTLSYPHQCEKMTVLRPAKERKSAVKLRNEADTSAKMRGRPPVLSKIPTRQIACADARRTAGYPAIIHQSPQLGQQACSPSSLPKLVKQIKFTRVYHLSISPSASRRIFVTYAFSLVLPLPWNLARVADQSVNSA